MKRRKQDKPRLPTWRDIQQSRRSSKKATTKVARKRRLVLLFRGAFAMLLLVSIAAGIIGIRYFGNLAAKPEIQSSNRVVNLKFQTDGVLTEAWARGHLAEFLRKDIRQVDVKQIKARLESEGQVAAASVKVALPSNLEIQLEERQPILRVRVRTETGDETLLLARDGTPYPGRNYPPDTLRRLPGVAGLRILRSDSGYEPVGGLEEVAFLLDYTSETLPSVYRHWQVVDLSDWDPTRNYRPSLVRIKSRQIAEIVFATTGIEQQVERLAGILEHTRRYQMGEPVFIDLSYGEEAVIRYN